MGDLVINEIAQKLVNGTRGDMAMQELRDRGYRLSSLNSISSRIRSAVLASCEPPDYSTLQAQAALEHTVTAFLAMSKSDQLSVQRSVASGTASEPWSDAARQALLRLRFLPANMDSFKLTQAEYVDLKRAREMAQLKKNVAGTIAVPNPAALLDQLTTLLETATAQRSLPELAFPILLATGRRLSAVMSFGSTWQPHPNPTYATFSGILKKRGASSRTADIPLLVPFATLEIGIRALRERQTLNAATRRKGHLPRAIGCTVDIKKRYSPSFNRALKAGRAMPLLPKCKEVKDLRAMYASFIYLLYESPSTLAGTCLTALVHTALKDSLSYNHIKVADDPSLRGKCGKLILPLERAEHHTDSASDSADECASDDDWSQ